MRLTVCLTTALTLLMASPAFAQLCIGSPSFRSGPYQVGISAAFTEGVRGVEGTFAGGGESVFAGAGVSVLNFNDVDVRTAGITAFIGAEVATDSRSRVLLCPIAQLGFVAGPDAGPIDVSSTTLRGGGSIGVVASNTGDAMIVPFFGLAALYQRISTEIGNDEASFSDTGGIVDLGVGFIFNDTVGITPFISIPFSAGADDPIFTIRFTFNFGR